jgi:hypothetical protein
MSLAVSRGVRFIAGGIEETWVPGLPIFRGLDEADRQILSAWLSRVGSAGGGSRGIDAAMDLSVRPWGVSGVGAIIGVFEPGQDRASWLIVGHGSGWTLARCADGFVSDVMSSLPAVLMLIDADRAAAEPF